MNQFLEWALGSKARYIGLALGKVQAADHSQLRYTRIIQGMSTGLLGKGVSVLVSFFAVPLTLKYLGGERYGVWVTISTAMMWIALADLGMSSSLTTAISEAYANDRSDLAQSYVSSVFWTLAGLAALLSAVFFTVWHSIPWIQLFNVHGIESREELPPAVAVAFVLFALQLPFSCISRIYAAYQQVAVANAWAATGSLLSLGALLLVTHLRGGLVSLVMAVSGSALFVSVLSAAWVFGKSKPWLVPRITAITRSSIGKLSGMGGMFFAIQIAALVLFQTDNLIIAHFLGAKAVTPYSVTWRLFTYTTIFQMLAGPSYWPAYAEAFARGDRAWVARNLQRNLTLSIGTTLMLCVPLLAFGRWFILKWAGSEGVPTIGLLFWMGVWSVISTAMNAEAHVLASCGRLRAQMIYSLIAAVVNLALSITLVRTIGLNGAILGTILAYLICIVGPTWMEVKSAIHKDESQPEARSETAAREI